MHAGIVYVLFFLHILIGTYSSTHAVCHDGDCNSEETQGKFVRLNEGENRPVLTNFAWVSEVE